MRYFIQLSYHGLDFHGWQVQPNAVTVQGELNKALSILLKQEVVSLGCGRTDTGVHARFFIAQFEADSIIDTDQLAYKLNRLIRLRLAVQKVWRAPDDANVRFDALSRTYKYYITAKKDPFLTDTAYYYTLPLDCLAMNLACKKLFDYSDFTSFSKLHTDVKTNNCSIMFAQWKQEQNMLIFTIKADRFLRNMVRAIVGTMIDVGRGTLGVRGFCEIIEQKDRSLAGTSAPAKGLFLENVEYPVEYGVAI